MKSQETILGFEARKVHRLCDDRWGQKRKTKYLLRPEIDRPLSTDSSVWPSIIRSDDQSTVRNIFNLYSDLSTLKNHLQEIRNSIREPYWIIGITLLSKSLNKEDTKLWNSMLMPTVPSHPDNSWSLLGYDISDTALLSGLSNCGYDLKHVHSLSNRWGSHLNQYHLFTDWHQAIEFKSFTDDRVREHAPFYVYGLYLIQSF